MVPALRLGDARHDRPRHGPAGARGKKVTFVITGPGGVVFSTGLTIAAVSTGTAGVAAQAKVRPGRHAARPARRQRAAVKPRLASQIVVSARPRPRGRPRKEEILEPSNAPPVTITDACGTLIAAYDPWTACHGVRSHAMPVALRAPPRGVGLDGRLHDPPIQVTSA